MARAPLFYSAVFVVLKRDDGAYLLQKRRNTGYMDDHYDLSVSGHVEPDESIIVSAVREASEEIGVLIDPDDLELAMCTQMNEERPYLNYIFLVTKWQGEACIGEPEKCSRLDWFHADEFPVTLTPTAAIFKEGDFTSKFHFEYVDKERLCKIKDSTTI